MHIKYIKYLCPSKEKLNFKIQRETSPVEKKNPATESR